MDAAQLTELKKQRSSLKTDITRAASRLQRGIVKKAKERVILNYVDDLSRAYHDFDEIDEEYNEALQNDENNEFEAFRTVNGLDLLSYTQSVEDTYSEGKKAYDEYTLAVTADIFEQMSIRLEELWSKIENSINPIQIEKDLERVKEVVKQVSPLIERQESHDSADWNNLIRIIKEALKENEEKEDAANDRMRGQIVQTTPPSVTTSTSVAAEPTVTHPASTSTAATTAAEPTVNLQASMGLQNVSSAARRLKLALKKTHHYTPHVIKGLQSKLEEEYYAATPTEEIEIAFRSTMDLYNTYCVNNCIEELQTVYGRIDSTVKTFQMKSSLEQEMLVDVYIQRVKNLIDQVVDVEGRCTDHGDWSSVKEAARRCLVRGKSLLPTSENSTFTPAVSSSSSFVFSPVVNPSSVVSLERSSLVKNKTIMELNNLGGNHSVDLNHQVNLLPVTFQDNSDSEHSGSGSHMDYPPAEVIYSDEGSAERETVISTDTNGSNVDLPLPAVGEETLVGIKFSNQVSLQIGPACKTTVLCEQFVPSGRSSLQVIHETPTGESADVDPLIVPPGRSSLQMLQSADVFLQIGYQSYPVECGDVMDQHLFESSCDNHVVDCHEDMNSDSSSCSFFSTVNQSGQKNKHSKAAQIPSIMEMFLHHGGESAEHGLSSCSSRCRSQYGTAPTIKLDGYHIGFSPHRDIVLTE